MSNSEWAVDGKFNKDLEQRVREGYFRADLYYRLNVVSVRLPSLREIKEDIPLLVDHFMVKLQPLMPSKFPEIAPEVMGVFLAYDWPGNARELQNVIERASSLCSGKRITVEYLPDALKEEKFAKLERTAEKGFELQHRVISAEKEQLLEALSKAAGNKSKAARLLNVHRTTLYYRMKKHNI